MFGKYLFIQYKVYRNIFDFLFTMSSLSECDATCQRKQNIQRLRNLYNQELDNYYNAYNQYIQYKTDNSAERAWKQTYADNTLRPQVEEINGRLNTILNDVKRNIQNMESQIREQEGNVSKYNQEIGNKMRSLYELSTNIEKTKKELDSKYRQVGFTQERNRSRKVMMIALVLVNALLVVLFYYYFIRTRLE